MTRNQKRFDRLLTLIGYFSKDEYGYYQEIGDYPECITESVLLEMEASLVTLTQETTTCEVM